MTASQATSPRRILVLGPGPTAIDAGGDLDAAAFAASAQLRALGHEVVLVTSNPASLTSQPTAASKVYVEPLDLESLRALLDAERPTDLCALFGGERAFDLVRALVADGTLARPVTNDGAPVALLGLDAADLDAFDPKRAPRARAALDVAVAEGWHDLELVVARDSTGAFVSIAAARGETSARIHPFDTTMTATDGTFAEAAARTAVGDRAGVFTLDAVAHGTSNEVRILAISPLASTATAFAELTTGLPVAAAAAALAIGAPLASLPAFASLAPSSRVVRAFTRVPHFPFDVFSEADRTLGPTRKSTGEAVTSGAAESATLDAANVPRRIVVVGPGPSRVTCGPEHALAAHEALLAIRAEGAAPIYLDTGLEALAMNAARAAATHIVACDAAHVIEACTSEGTREVFLQVGGDAATALAPALVAAGLEIVGTGEGALARARELTARAPDPTSLTDAVGVDVDLVSDGSRVVIAGVTEHLEPTYVHGGDAAAMVPPVTLRPDVVARVEDHVRALAVELGVVGLLAVRLAVEGETIHVLAVEPRAGRTTELVSRATGIDLATIGTKVALGRSLDELGVAQRAIPRHVAARERVFPFERLGVDTALGGAMRSTGEVLGIDDTPARAYAKALRGIGFSLRTAPRGLILDVTERDRSAAVELARRFRAVGFEIQALGATRQALVAARIPAFDLERDEAALERIRGGHIGIAIVTASGDAEVERTRALRGASLAAHLPCFTTIALARLGCSAVEQDSGTARVRPLAEWYAADT